MEKLTITCKCGTVLSLTPGDTGDAVFCTKCGERVEIPADMQAKIASIRASAPANPGSSNEPPRTSGKAIASLILSLCAVLTCGITGLIGLILGILALKDTAKPNVGGRGLAIAGIVMGPVLMVFMLPIIAAIAIPAFMATSAKANETNAIGTLSAIRSAQAQYNARNNTYGSFGDLSAAEYLEQEGFDVGAGTAERYGYTFKMTITGPYAWNCVAVPDSGSVRWLKIDETGMILMSKDNGTTWNPLE